MGPIALEVGELVTFLRMDDSDFQRKLSSSGQNMQRFGQTASTALTALGTAAGVGFAAASKAAVGWEASWAGVTKTVDASASELATLEDQLRDMASSLPATHTEIAAVAEAAGQLGVAAPDIADFTRVMIDLGETTNLTSDEAATALAQLMNVMKTSGDDVDELGSAIVALGNDGASTEAEIVNMAQRLSGSGQLIGASEQGVLALSSALASVGITAEAGGGALSRVLQDIHTDVMAGGEDMAGWAEVAQMSASDFATAWETDPISALDAFVQGLAKIDEAGGNSIATLADLGIKSTEETRALLSLAGAGDVLTGSIETANTAWSENTALTEEATQRYATTEAQLEVVRNALVEIGITVGGSTLPVLSSTATGLAELFRAVADQAQPIVDELLPSIIPIADAIGARLSDAAESVRGMDVSQLVDQIGELSEYATPLAGVAAGLFAMGTQIRPLQALGLSINPVAAALLAVVVSSDDARESAMNLLSSFSDLSDETGDLLAAAGDLANVVLAGLVTILGGTAEAAGGAGGAVDLLELGLDGLTGAVQLVTGVVGPLVDFLGGLIEAADGAEGPILGIVAALVLMRTVDVSGVVSRLTGALSAGKATWGASQATLQALGREAGLMNTAMMSARSGVTALGGAVRGLVVANAPMLAIAGLAAVIGTFIGQAAEAKARSDELITTFDELTGAATADTDMMILTQLNEQISSADWDILKEMGYSYQDVVDVIKEGGPALEAFYNEVDVARISQHGWSEESKNTAGALSSLQDGLREVGPAYSTAAEQAAELAAQNDQVAGTAAEVEVKASDTTGALQTLEDALGVLSDEASSAEQRLDALNDILDLMAGGVPSVTEATIDHADALRDITAAAEEFGFSQEQLNAILNDDGSLNAQSEAVSALRGEMETLVGTAQTQADALIEAGDTEGAIQAYADLDQQLRDFATTAGVENPAAVEALIGSLGLLPPEVMVDLQMNGGDAAAETIEMVRQRIAEIPDSVMTYINGDTSGIETKVDETGLRMAYVASMAADPMIGADDSENLNIVAAAVARLNEIDGMEPTPELNAEKSALERVVGEAKVDINSVPDKTAQVTAETYGFGSIQEMKRAIDRIQNKSVTVTVRTVGVQSTITAGRTRGVSAEADGGVYSAPGVKAFADGGEHHVAQIAAAGAWRLWAEPETGGEAYVPLAAHKRARSLAIMHDVAARFGHVMVPAHATRYANGGTNAAPATQQYAPPSALPPINVNGYGAHEVAALVQTRVERAIDSLPVVFPGG